MTKQLSDWCAMSAAPGRSKGGGACESDDSGGWEDASDAGSDFSEPAVDPSSAAAHLATAYGGSADPDANLDLAAGGDTELLADPLWRLDLPAYVGEQLRAFAAAQPAEFAALAGELNVAQRGAVQGCFS